MERAQKHPNTLAPKYPESPARRSLGIWLFGYLGVFLFLLSGCGKEDIRVYRAPRETNQQLISQGGALDQPHVHYELPDGWTERAPSGMRVASFQVSANGRQADVSVIPLSLGSGSELDNVNRWRGEVSLPPITEGDLPAHGELVEVSGEQARLYDMASEEPLRDEQRIRTLAVMLPTDERVWFIKMMGEADLVASQKSAFKNLLLSLTLHEADAHEEDSVAAPVAQETTPALRDTAAASHGPQWDLPPHWQEQAAPPMVASYFLIDEGKANLAVSVFPGDVGGPLANVNRWRAQLGLSSITAAQLSSATNSVDVPGGKAMLVEMTGQDPRTSQPAAMIVLSVPRDGRTWFYKMMGDPSVVSREKPALIKLVQGARY